MLFVPRDQWLLLVVGFVIFRFFDIAKPPPVRQIDQKVGGGLGVVLDDVGAGIYGCILMVLIARFVL
jgi:phosphatidylglycerophosphatase A